MKLHKETAESLEPCKHMEGMLNRTAEGSAPPLMKWYALWHAKGCSRCGTFLARMTALIAQLKGLHGVGADSIGGERLGDDRWTSLESKWSEVEESTQTRK
ncbi:MAG: hypothetical protein P4L46_24930 [Fimbriimonas sp.]|nr:hypothetical protein [Fimbriimonas sp.]